MEFTINYPGSFGEVLQGKINKKDLLLSCPINIYTKVKVFECNNAEKKFANKKSATFLQNVLKLWGREEHFKNLDIEIDSQIPYGKGLASSTADLCAVYLCLLKLFNREFNEEELIEQCIKIEPTDSIIFREMTLFDYKKGSFKQSLGKYLNYNILAFEGKEVIDTVEFNNKILPPLSDVDDLLPILEEAIKDRDLKKLAHVSTESIIRNQNRLPYEFLSEVLDIKNRTSGLGIIGAHSGNVLGIIYEDINSLNYAVQFAEKLSMCKVYPVETLSEIYG
jgi:L-threonine kinase